MPLYRISEDRFVALKHKPAQKEKELQQLIETNLLELLGVHLLGSEYSTTTGGRIDTLGVDQNGAPVIIEYKRNQNDNVINQALSYRKWLTSQKPEFFEMLIRKRLPVDVANALEVDWRHPRIICIAESFNRFDIDTADVLLSAFRVELMTYRFYESEIFHLEPLQMIDQRQMSASSAEAAAGEPVGSIEHSVESHRSRGSPQIQSTFDDLRAQILALGPQIIERAVGAYIGYRTSKNFVEVQIQRSRIKLHLRGINDDPRHRATKVPDARGWALNYETWVDGPAELDYAMRLVEQSYNDVA